MGSVGSGGITKRIDSLQHISEDVLVNPLFDETDKNMGIVEGIDRNIDDTRHALLTEVQTSQLMSVQRSLSRSNLEKVIQSYSQIDSPLEVIEYNDKYYIMDGNHRAVAARLLNKRKVSVKVLNRIGGI